MFVSVIGLLVVSTEKLLVFDQALGKKPLLKVLEIILKSRAKNLEISVPIPKISNSILTKFRNLAPNLGSQITVCLA